MFLVSSAGLGVPQDLLVEAVASSVPYLAEENVERLGDDVMSKRKVV